MEISTRLTNVAIELNFVIKHNVVFDKAYNTKYCYLKNNVLWNKKSNDIFSIMTPIVETRDIDNCYDIFRQILKDNYEAVNYAQNIAEETQINILINIYDGLQPAIYFEGDFIELIRNLNAQINLDYHIY